ncbi:thiolase-like protein [Mycena amicta]|nr:thiolase-like protein [Mycena amicta]
MSPSAKAAVLAKHDDDVVIVSAIRTALTKGKKGGFKDTHPEELLAHVLRHVYTSVKLDPKLIEDVAVGNVLPPGGGASAARMAALHAGIPNTAAVNTVNRQCSSGLTAINQIANEIKTGEIDFGIGAGVESMTKGFGAGVMPASFSDVVLSTQEAADCLIPMGITSENSFQKAAKAQKEGRFKDEILPIQVTWIDPKTEEEKKVVVDSDDGVRDGVTKESLAKLKPAFTKTGSTHAGNASQVSDGAAAVLLTRRSLAKKLGLPILGKFVHCRSRRCSPKNHGCWPSVLEKTGLTTDEIDFYEINEAFASQAVFSVQHLGIDFKKVNKHGGALPLIVLTPRRVAGARQVATGLNIAKQYGDKIFATSMCVGS